MAYRDIDLQVRCPYCRATLGRYCRKSHPTRNLGFTRNPHRARVQAADARVAEQASQPDG